MSEVTFLHVVCVVALLRASERLIRLAWRATDYDERDLSLDATARARAAKRAEIAAFNEVLQLPRPLGPHRAPWVRRRA